MVGLSTDDRRRLHDALLGAFPSRDDVAALVLLAFNVPLDSVVGPDVPNTTVVLKVIEWAEARGLLAGLLDEAAAQRPENHGLLTVLASVRATLAGGASLPAPAPARGAAAATVPPATPSDPGGGAAAGVGGPLVPGPGGYFKVVLGFAIVIIAAVLALVFSRDTITSAQWGVAKPVLAVACAVIAAFLPGVLQVELGGWLRAGGALAVFAIVYLMPGPAPEADTATFTGYVLYRGSNSPVRDAVVVYPANNLKSNATADDGFFSLPGVPATVTDLTWQFRGQSGAFKVSQTAGGRYDVIARPARAVDFGTTVVPAGRWVAAARSCSATTAVAPAQAFRLQVDIGANPPATAAHLRVVALDSGSAIAEVLDVKPDSALTIATGVDAKQARQWEFSPIPPEGLEASVILCLSGAPGANPAAALRSEYWYRRFE